MTKTAIIISGALISLILNLPGSCWAAGEPGSEFKIVHLDYLPFAGTESGKSVGAYVETAKQVCEKMQLKCSFEQVPLRRAEKMVGDGEAHAFLAIGESADRKKVMHFTEPVTSVGMTFFVKKGQAAKVAKVEDLIGKKIGVFGPSTTSRGLDATNQKVGGKLTIETDSDVSIPLKKLDGGRYGADGAAYSNRAIGSYQAKLLKYDIEPVAFDTETSVQAISLTKKGLSEEFAKKFSNEVKAFLASPEGQEAFKKWGVQPFKG